MVFDNTVGSDCDMVFNDTYTAQATDPSGEIVRDIPITTMDGQTYTNVANMFSEETCTQIVGECK